MANGYFERGEVYKIRMDYGIGGEEGAFRPGVVISGTKTNNVSGLVSVAYLSRKSAGRVRTDFDVETYATGIASYVLCNQIASIDKSRLGGYMGKLDIAEEKAVDDVLEELFDLGYIDSTVIKEKESEIAARDIQIKELKEEVAKLNEQIATRADDDMARKVEIEMWQRLYEKALDQVCSMKLTGDITRRTSMVVAVEEKPEKKVVSEPIVEDEPKLVDINTAKFDELKKCGLSSNIILSIMNKRPHASVEDLKKIPGVTNILYGIVSKKVCCSTQPKPQPVSALVEPDPGHEPERVNINTAKAKEIMAVLGVGNNAAYGITGYRKKNGPFASLEELIDVPYWSEKMLEKHRDKLEV